MGESYGVGMEATNNLEAIADATWHEFRAVDAQAKAARELGWKLNGVGMAYKPCEAGNAAHAEAQRLQPIAIRLHCEANGLFMQAGMMPRFLVHGHCELNGRENTGVVGFIGADCYVPTKADALRIAAEFPKSYGVRGYYVSGDTEWGGISISAHLSADGANKGKNEGGIARMRKFLAKVPHEFDVRLISNAASVDQLKAIVT